MHHRNIGWAKVEIVSFTGYRTIGCSLDLGSGPGVLEEVRDKTTESV
jgi:hypothetical protein